MPWVYKDYSKYGFRLGMVRKCYRVESPYPNTSKEDKKIKLKSCAANVPTLKQWEAAKVGDIELTPNGKLYPAFIVKGPERKQAYLLSKKQKVLDKELDDKSPISYR